MADAASDADREEAVRELTRHCGDGRLTLDELEDRIAEVYAASNVAEIEHALRELPKAKPAVSTPPRPPRTAPPTPARDHAADRLERNRAGAIALQVHLWVFVGVMLMLTAIWFLTSGLGYFWPIWTAVPWGTAVIIHAAIHKTISNS